MKKHAYYKFLFCLLNCAFLTLPFLYGCGKDNPVATTEIQTFFQTFGGMSADEAYSVRQTSDGGYIIAGRTMSFGASDYEVWLVKTNASGGQLWSETFSGSDRERASCVQQTNDEGYIIAGSTRSFGAGERDAWLIKTDASGNQVWAKTFGGSETDNASSVQQTTDGGYILVGSTRSFGIDNIDVWLIKTDASGDQVWIKTFGGDSTDNASSVWQTTDSGYIIAGSTMSFGAGKSDAWLIKTDANGNQEWTKTYGGSEWDWAFSVQQTEDGGYIVAGNTESFGADDVWLIKTDTDGNQIWAKTFGGSGSDWARSVRQTTDGGYILTGTTNSFGAGDGDVWLIKTGANGNQVWNRTFGGEASDSGQSVQQTTDGGYIIAGMTRSFGGGETDALLIKTDANGNVASEQ